jgi:glycosyltransferase involved in cell wall biosynthesis
VNVAVISSRFPYGRGEPYLDTELRILQQCLGHITVAAVRPGENCRASAGWTHLEERGVDDIVDAMRALRRAPRRALHAFRTIVTSPTSLRGKVKNALVFPRSLALAERFSREGIEHVHAYWLSTPATAAFVVAHVNDHSWSATAHRWDIFEDNMARVKIASAAFVRTVSDRGRRELLRLTKGVRGSVSVVRLGTALDGPPARPASGGTIAILCAAAFVPVKAHADLLAAFATARTQDARLQLVLAGDGPLRARVQRMASDLALRDAVVFRGNIDRPRLLEELRQGRYAAVVLASRDDGLSEMEGIPSILIEAMSLGIPCIATLSGSVRELLDESCGFPVAQGSPPDLAAAILEVARDAESTRARARAGMTRARALHSPMQTASAFARLFDRTMPQGKISA